MSVELITNSETAEVRFREIIERFRQTPLSTLETYGYFDLDDTPGCAEARAEQEHLFLNREVKNPRLNYPVLAKNDTAANLADLERTVLDLMVQSAYLAYDEDREAALYDIRRVRRLEVGLLDISRLLATSQSSDGESEEAVKAFNLANDEVHGKLETDKFRGLLFEVQEESRQLLRNDIPEVVNEATRYFIVHSGAVALNDGIKKPLKVNPEQLNKLKDLITERFSDLIECVPEKPGGETLSIGGLAEVFKKAHQVRCTGWGVRIQPGKKSVDTRQSECNTVIGDKRKQPTSAEARALLIHENGVHVERRRQGDASGDVLLGGTGLAGYLDAEEGLAKILEQAISGKASDSGVQYYIALGLARGLDGTPRDFRDVYELEYRRRIIKEYEDRGVVDEKRPQKLKELAYNTCVRIFRGTPCDIPGMVYTKDQAYFMGNQKMLDLVFNIVDLPDDQRNEAFSMLFTAKYDPTNTLHVRLVNNARELREQV